MSTEMKSNSCRICLTTNVGGVKLDKNSEMLKVLEFCVDFAVDLTFAPKIICEKCVEEIDKFAKFKRKCIESEELWKSVNKYNNEIECNITNAMKETKHCEGTYNEEVYNELVADGIKQSKVKGSISVIVPTIVKDFKSYSRNNTKDNEKHSSVDKKKYFCTKCNKEYSSNKWLVTHKRNVCYKDKYKDDTLENVKRDDDESTQNCGLCQTSLTDIKSHLDEHWHNNDLLCKICNYTGRDFADMITHRHIHCKKTKLYCHACNKKKASILSLQFHFRSVHLHKTGGLCSICSKTFAKFKTWKKHVRLHNEENSLFICDICGKKNTLQICTSQMLLWNAAIAREPTKVILN
ncbi:zinc finger protein 678-like isoform X2 [Danaus plexippus]|uniref:zinc finger protein 678-like isoform X2 n=1 Tax=Danaus plexippus TaxID=13037 RepID=UPI002AB124B8|nr:zinc finger protein 678-like isoform X2 [Danaus plexippus]